MAVLDIQALKEEPGILVSGLARINGTKRKIASNQSHYVTFDLGNVTGSIPAFVWPEKYHGNQILQDNEIMKIVGRTKYISRQHKMTLDLYEATPVSLGEINPVELMMLPSGTNRHDVNQLVLIMESLIPPLREFICSVFADNGFALSFIQGKASNEYHHSCKGGLLRHSLEVADFVNRHAGLFPQQELDVAIVAALLHDAGKTRDYYNCHKSTISFVNHDQRTLEMLGNPLAKLDKIWPEGAEL